MKAFIVKPKTKEVIEIDIEDILDNTYKHLECYCFCRAGWVDENHTAWVDDEGLFKVKDDHNLTLVQWYPQALVGNILITGLNKQGDTTAATLELEQVKAMVKFVPALHFFHKSKTH